MRTRRLWERARTEATYGWDTSPITLAASISGDVGADQERGLVVGVGRRVCEPLAAANVVLR